MIDLVPIATATLQGWYTTAVNAFNNSMVGGRIVATSYSTPLGGGRSVTFNPASIDDLRAWIDQLARELECRGAMTRKRTRRAIGIRF